MPHTVEEAYEVADAALAGDDAKLLDELGDLLFQTYFLALLLSERGAGDLERVARGIHAKLVARHPHVFGDVEARTAGRVRENWERIKVEQEGREGVFHDVPEALPACSTRARCSGVRRRWGSTSRTSRGRSRSSTRSSRELRPRSPAADAGARERAATRASPTSSATCSSPCVNVARRLNVDPELELRRDDARGSVRGSRRRSARAARDGRELERADLDGQDRYFERGEGGRR